MKSFILFASLALVPVAAASAEESGLSNLKDRSAIALVVENDLFADSDRGYTNGLRIGYSPPAEKTPSWMKSVARTSRLFPQDGQYRAAFTLGQNMYTPSDITDPEPDPDDRPYAGWLYGTAAIIGANDNRLNSLELSLGIVGPASLAEESQTFVHDILDADEPRGWDSQLENEPAMMLSYQRRWRIWDDDFGPVDASLTPHIGGAVGNVFTYANIGATARIGYNAGPDFGPPRIQPSVPGSGNAISDGFGIYLFASLEGRAMAQNIFLDGNSFRDSPSVDKETFVGDAQFGIVMTYDRVMLAYTHVLRTDEFKTQTDNTGFGALSLSILY